MLYLLLAIITSAMTSIVMRLSNEKISNNIAMLTVSYFTAASLAALHLDFGSLLTDSVHLPTTISMAMMNGCLYMSGFVMMQQSIPKNGVVLTSTYMRLGLIVCMTLSVIFFKEFPTGLQFLGFCLAVGAILLNGDTPSSKGSRFNSMLLLLLVISGLCDIWIKVFDAVKKGLYSDWFLMFTFFMAGLLCLGLMLYKKQRIGSWEFLFGIAIAFPNYYNSRFLLKSLGSLPGIIVYPTFSVGTLLLITVLGVCLFKEKLSRRGWCSLGIILVALALLNL